jgi:plastocyanin
MRVFATGVLALCVAAPTTFAGSITGKVTLSPVHGADVTFRPYAGRATSLPAPAKPARGKVTDTIIYVETAPAGAHLVAAPAEPPQLAQRGQAFVPRVVVVRLGGTVSFPNFDPIYHNVFSVSPVRRFDLGKYPRGQTRRVTFTKPGVVNVFCDIHADMAAFVLVTPTPAWTRATADGRFELAGLPPGRYRVSWWHPDLPGGGADVEVPAQGAITLDVGL